MTTSSINLKRQLSGDVEATIERLTAALKERGFGVLNRIDLHAKFKEKLGKEVPAVVILGACSPELAYEAYQANPDVTSLLPCNAVVRDVGGGAVSVELAKPTAMMRALGDRKLEELAREADLLLQQALESL